FFAKLIEILWLLYQENGISERTAQIESAISMSALFAVAGVLAVITDRDDAPYFVLLAIPILQCGYHFGLFPTLTTVAAAIAMIFGWAHHYYAIHPPPRPTELLESGMISLIYMLMGVLVWSLVNQLRNKELLLFRKMSELETARESLAREEKLAAVGRLATGIAHEIRNPVAVIASSMATAAYPDLTSGERDEMLQIAEREAKRLENLTSDFLSYAKPAAPQRDPTPVADLLRHVSNAARVRAAEKSIHVDTGAWEQITITIDSLQIEGALVNLCLNAIDATPPGGRISLKTRVQQELLLIDISDSGPAIPEGDLSRIFEPFFTTKRKGSGLGLAIATGVARAHGGELWVSSNVDGEVTFTLSLKMLCDSEEG
ncbi:MAG TPA: ATP-binding protein, partial [Acidobacteriaceae bacterium]|nr:ATP-binding protein [Acidobacteriaceae bacterium]